MSTVKQEKWAKTMQKRKEEMDPLTAFLENGDKSRNKLHDDANRMY